MLSPPPSRDQTLARLADETFDVLVVGAGTTGAAIARDAALRGLRVALCDRGDFGGETSSHSSKLIHGGIRYLEHGHLHLVFESLGERRTLMKIAPHLCRPLEFVFPCYRGQSPSLTKLTLGVALYDALALWRPPVRSRRLDPSEIRTLAPELRDDGLTGAMAYIDCQTDDARLVLEHVLDAEAAGAVVASYLEVSRPQRRKGHLHRMTARDRLSDGPLAIAARAVVNATGPFSDAFRGGAPALRPTLGVHVVFDAQRLPTGSRAFVVRAPGDGRVTFVLPAGARTIVGTTDTDWGRPGESDGPPTPGDDIRARGTDVAYLLQLARHNFPGLGLGPGDVLATFAGLRPLLASDESNPSASSREHAIWVDDAGVLTIAGGKLTTLRRMAEEAVDHLRELLATRGSNGPLLPCITTTRPLPGGRGFTGNESETLASLHELAEDVKGHLVQTYGVRAREVLALYVSDPTLRRRLSLDLAFTAAEVVFAVRHEHALEVSDVLMRRLPMARLDRDNGLGAAEWVSDLMAKELGWSEARRQASLLAFRREVERTRAWRQD